MKMTIRYILALALFALGAVSTASAHDKSKPLDDSQKAFLSQYEQVRSALAADDLDGTKKAATAIKDSDPAATIAKATSLDEAREGFKKLSKKAVHLAGAQKGYYVAHCPMVPNDEGNWVQTSKKISNPYQGQKMPTCGSLVED